MTNERHRIPDEIWKKLASLLPPPKTKRSGRPRNSDREIVEGILWVLRTGAPWRDLPSEFPSWKTCYTRYSRWVKAGIFERILDFLTTESDDEWHMMDSTVIRAHQHAAGMHNEDSDQALGRSRGGFSSKIHTKVDSLGMPLKFIITGGQRADSTQAIPLMAGSPCDALLGDAGYDTDSFRSYLEAASIEAVIKPSGQRAIKPYCDWSLYKARNAIERFFSKIKQWRRVASHYDKTAQMYMGGVILAGILVWLM